MEQSEPAIRALLREHSRVTADPVFFDPRAFDRPDELDITRRPNSHISFGAGIHFCLGAPLARVELQTSFATLLRRFPDMELAAAPVWKDAYIVRGLKELRVSF